MQLIGSWKNCPEGMPGRTSSLSTQYAGTTPTRLYLWTPHLTPQEAVNRSLSKPSQCDVVVVILWGRMGTPLPESYKKPNGTLYLSGTEWECEDVRWRR
jgi:hypothetical protein